VVAARPISSPYHTNLAPLTVWVSLDSERLQLLAKSKDTNAKIL